MVGVVLCGGGYKGLRGGGYRVLRGGGLGPVW